MVIQYSRSSETPKRISHLMHLEFEGIRTTRKDISNIIARENCQSLDGMTLGEWFLRAGQLADLGGQKPDI